MLSVNGKWLGHVARGTYLITTDQELALIPRSNVYELSTAVSGLSTQASDLGSRDEVDGRAVGLC